MAFHIAGELDASKLEQAFKQTIARHEALRTSLKYREGQVVQIVHPKAEFRLPVQEVASEAELRDIMEAFIQPFAMSAPPLLRARLLRIGLMEHILLLDMHHTITDGTSVGIMLDELFRLYDGLELPAVTLQYKDYAVWKADRLARGQYDESAQYWKRMLQGYKPFTLPVDYDDYDPLDHGGDIVATHIPDHLFEEIETTSAEKRNRFYHLIFDVLVVAVSKERGDRSHRGHLFVRASTS